MPRDHEARTVFPIFVGSGRSGTTLLRAVFNAHTQLAVAMESHFLVPLFGSAKGRSGTSFDPRRATELVGRSPGLAKMGLELTDVARALANSAITSPSGAARAIFAAYARKHGKPLYGDKTPGYIRHIPDLAQALPETRFIHIIRDGRDAAAAYMTRDFGPRNAGEAATYWKRNVEAGMAAGRELGPARYTEVRYEDLVADFDAEVARLTAFLGLPLDEATLRYWETHDPTLANQPGSGWHESARLPPVKGLRKWRDEMTEHDVGVFQAIAGRTLKACGYEMDDATVTPATRVSAAREWLGWQFRGMKARIKARNS